MELLTEAYFASEEGAKPPSILAAELDNKKSGADCLVPKAGFFPTEDAFYLLVGKVLRQEGLGGRAGHKEKRSGFSLSVKGNHTML